MNTLQRLTCSGVLLTLTSLTMSCTPTQEGAFIGGALGSAAGGAITDSGTGMVVGGLLGAAAGAAIGDDRSYHRGRYHHRRHYHGRSYPRGDYYGHRRRHYHRY